MQPYCVKGIKEGMNRRQLAILRRGESEQDAERKGMDAIQSG